MENEYFTPDEIDEILFEECCGTDFNAALSFFMRVLDSDDIRVRRDRSCIKVVDEYFYFNQQGEMKRNSAALLYLCFERCYDC